MAKQKKKPVDPNAPRKSKQRKRKHQEATPADPRDLEKYTLVLDRNIKHTRDEAIIALEKSNALKAHCPRFYYEDSRRKAVIVGRIEIEIPFRVAKQILGELAPTWLQGKRKPVEVLEKFGLSVN